MSGCGRKRVKKVPALGPSLLVGRLLADADAAHAMLDFLEMDEMCTFRATCSAAKAAVATYPGPFKTIDDGAITTGQKFKVNFPKWRACFAGVTDVSVFDYGCLLTDVDIACLSGAVRSLTFATLEEDEEGEADDEKGGGGAAPAFKVTASGFARLTGLKQLTIEQPLNAADLKLTAASLAAIAPTLTYLRLADVTGKTARAVWTDGLSTFKSLEMLWLTGNFGPTPALLAGLPALRRLYTEGNDAFPSSPGCWPHMGGLEVLFVMDYDRLHPSDPPFPNAMFKHLKHVNCVKLFIGRHFAGAGAENDELSASSSAADFAALAAAGSIEILGVDARFLKIDDGALSELAKGGTLTTLQLIGPHTVSGKVLGELTSLRELTLDHCGLSDHALQPLPHLTSLSLRHCPNVSDDELAALALTLTSLTVDGCHGVTVEGLRRLPRLRRLPFVPRYRVRRLPFVCSQRDCTADYPAADIRVRLLLSSSSSSHHGTLHRGTVALHPSPGLRR